jgi:hypothetical protein
MKEVTILGETFKYEIINTDESRYTVFYLGEEEKVIRKYWLFGPKTTKKYPKEAFVFSGSVENLAFTKDEIRELLEGLVKTKVFRKREIENGELV